MTSAPPPPNPFVPLWYSPLPPAGATVRLGAIDCGRKRLPSFSFLIEHPRQRLLFGFPPALAEGPRAAFGRAGSLLDEMPLFPQTSN